MIIFGSHMYGKRNVVRSWGCCDKCGQYCPSTSYNGRSWGHIYFIPLIPTGSRVRVVKECVRCLHGTHIPELDVPVVLSDIHRRSDAAVRALVAGREKFDDNGDSLSSAECLVSSVEMLCCLQEEHSVTVLLDSLQQKGLTSAYYLVHGQSREFHGQLGEAAHEYLRAAECAPSDTFPLMCLGATYVRNRDYWGARPVYEQALELSKDRFPVLRILLTVYQSLGESVKFIETYEDCLRLVPELTWDGPLLRAYKMACEGVGRQPIL